MKNPKCALNRKLLLTPRDGSFSLDPSLLIENLSMKKILLRAVCLGALALLPTGRISAQEPSPGPKLDFGDFSSSAITTKAWKAYESKNYDDTLGYTGKCIEMFKGKAVEMQKALGAPPTEKAKVFEQWALNDVGTCYYIQAKALEGQGKSKEALDSYKFLAENLPFAQCWDTKGWFWKPGDAAKERLKALEFDSLK